MSKPSVTQLLDLLAKPALIAWANKQGLAGIEVSAYRRSVMAVGSSMHEQIESEAFTDESLCIGYGRFMRDKEILGREVEIETEWFVGRYDARLLYGGESWLIDYKKSRRHRMHLEHKLQLVAYSMAQKVDRLGIVALPDFALVECVLTDAERAAAEGIVIALAQMYPLLAMMDPKRVRKKRKRLEAPEAEATLSA